jgi:hypothetical protein
MYAPVLWLSGITWTGLEAVERVLRRAADEEPHLRTAHELLEAANAAHAELCRRPRDPNADLL